MSSVLQLDPSIVSASEHKQNQFVMCDNCFWCASALSNRQHDVEHCPECGKPVSAIPIASNEAYRYSLTPTRGLELEFTSKR